MLHILIHGDYTSIYHREVLGIKFAYSQVQSSFNAISGAVKYATNYSLAAASSTLSDAIQFLWCQLKIMMVNLYANRCSDIFL